MASGDGPSGLSTTAAPRPALRGVKRSHAEMNSRSISPLFEPSDDSPSPPHTSRRQGIILPPLEPSIISDSRQMPPPRRVERSRSRRPPPTTSADVIDLTSDNEEDSQRAHTVHPAGANSTTAQQRLPRHERNVFIDLSVDSSPPERAATPVRASQEDSRRPTWEAGRRLPSLVRESSSNLTFLEARPRPPGDFFFDDADWMPLSPRPSPPRRRTANTGMQTDRSGAVDLTAEDDVIFMGETQRPRHPHSMAETMRRVHDLDMANDIQQSFASRIGGRFSGLSRMLSNLGARFDSNTEDEGSLENFIRRYAPIPGPGVGARPALPNMPNMMNYGSVGFDMGFIGGGRDAPAPKYEAPPAAEAGFTRTPTQEEEVVCPACGDELAIGDAEDKRQVWVVKACGHVYCGECMANRKKSAKGKAREVVGRQPIHFSECLVDGCGNKMTHKSHTFQIFL